MDEERKDAIVNVVWNYLGLTDPVELADWFAKFYAFSEALGKPGVRVERTSTGLVAIPTAPGVRPVTSVQTP